MITRDGKLEIFENFIVDASLPKHFGKKRSELSKMVNAWVDYHRDSDSESKNDGDVGFIQAWREPEEMDIPGLVKTEGDGFIIGNRKYRNKKVWSFLLFPILWMVGLFRKKKMAKIEAARMSVKDFFASIKNSARELEILAERAAGYEKALINATKAGQVALKERLLSGLDAHRSETQLFASDHKKYVTEEDVVKFVKQAKRGLRLDWIKNFTRIIPNEVIFTKVSLDELTVFDNYVVMHYDPNKNSWAETQEEANRRRDPILFGVILGSRKLYFVGDWVDDLCDLTLEQIAAELGQQAIKEIV
jgi:hypothetical protein